MVKKLGTLVLIVVCSIIIGFIAFNAPIEQVSANANAALNEVQEDQNKVSLNDVEIEENKNEKRTVEYTNQYNYEITLNKENISIETEDEGLTIDVYFEKDGKKSNTVNLKPNEKVNIEIVFTYNGDTSTVKELSYQIKIEMMKKI